MKINDIMGSFSIALSNEESQILEGMPESVMPLDSFPEREQTIIENLVRKSLISKIVHKGRTLVVRNDQ